VKPILTYGVYQRKEKTSWRPWGGLQTEADAEEEVQRIQRELTDLASNASFSIDLLPLSAVKTVDELAQVNDDLNAADVTLIYPAGGQMDLLEAIVAGPLYLWYEIVHPIFLRKRSDEFRQPGVGLDDVVVDDYGQVLSRLQALYGLKNTRGEKVISVGPAGGWGRGDEVVSLAHEKWGLEVDTVPYEDLAQRLKAANSDVSVVEQAQEQAREYVSGDGITLETDMQFVSNAFVLYRVFKDLMREMQADVITVGQCMSTIMPLAETTACLPLSLINDDGQLAFCESDFVVIPSGILLHHIAGKPVFLNDPTFPHDGVVTLAHCTAPRKMDGVNYEDARIVTHFESDYGAAPKVEFSRGQEVTVIVPDFNEVVWTGFRGHVLDAPFYPTCRSQVDIEIDGDCDKLLREMKGFHWMMCYGDYLTEIGYAVKKAGIDWVTL
jgi:L-fucose isomerase-like protein